MWPAPAEQETDRVEHARFAWVSAEPQTSTHLASGASHPLCTPEVRRWIEPLDVVPIATMTYCRVW